MEKRSKVLFVAVIVVALLVEPVTTKRGGGGFGRGASAGRASSAGRWSGGRGVSHGTHSSPGRTSGGWTGGGMGSVGHGQGHIGRGTGQSRPGTSWSKPSGSFGHGIGGYDRRPSKYKSGSGIGSAIRGSTFKNMIVGAAAGYLTYQAGKAIIRSMTAPMYWNNRPYYWGSQYYQPPSYGGHMCHMPIDPNDRELGSVYTAENTRPKEITWGCRNNEVCCGYECCPSGGYGGGWWNGGSRVGLGSILVLLLFCACGAFISHQICKARRRGNGSSPPPRGSMGTTKYSPGEVVYGRAAEPPPLYSSQPPPKSMMGCPPPPQPRFFH